MVNHCCRLHSPLRLAANAQRVRPEKACASLLPLVAVATLRTGLIAGAPAASLHRLHSPGIQHWQTAFECLELCHVYSKDCAAAYWLSRPPLLIGGNALNHYVGAQLQNDTWPGLPVFTWCFDADNLANLDAVDKNHPSCTSCQNFDYLHGFLVDGCRPE